MMPARQSMIPGKVAAARLMNAVALSTAGTNVMRLAGASGGWSAAGRHGSRLGLRDHGPALCQPRRRKSELPVVTSRAEFKANNKDLRNAAKTTSMRSGFRELIEANANNIGRDRVIFWILAVSFMIVALSQPYQMTLPGFAEDILHADPTSSAC